MIRRLLKPIWRVEVETLTARHAGVTRRRIDRVTDHVPYPPAHCGSAHCPAAIEPRHSQANEASRTGIEPVTRCLKGADMVCVTPFHTIPGAKRRGFLRVVRTLDGV
jgi:hypothetical protein